VRGRWSLGFATDKRLARATCRPGGTEENNEGNSLQSENLARVQQETSRATCRPRGTEENNEGNSLQSGNLARVQQEISRATCRPRGTKENNEGNCFHPKNCARVRFHHSSSRIFRWKAHMTLPGARAHMSEYLRSCL
jgi:hypothetical protein